MIFIFLILLPGVIAVDNYNGYRSLTLDVNISSSLDLKYKSSNFDISYVNVDLSLFPRNFNGQEVLSLDTFSVPDAKIERSGTSILYSWEKPTVTKLRYGLDAKVKVNDQLNEVNKKVNFPIVGINPIYLEYLEAQDKIDINEDIRKKANDIIEGETDLYLVVFKIADWVRNNIEYDLNTLTADAAQKSSWVFINKQGVCDELTGLFISMLRSVGIPARFVSGLVYTNLLNDWGPHGWAEVYFPGYGWVPFDVTFGQYGWIDVSHVKLQESLDSGATSVYYTWRSRDVDVDGNDINIRVKEIESEKRNSLLKLDINLLENNVGGGSYVPLEVQVENPNNFYVSSTVSITKAPTLIKDNTKEVFLKPKEKKGVYWLVEIPTDLRHGFFYKGVIEVKDAFGSFDSDELIYAWDEEVVSFEDALSQINLLMREDKKEYSRNINIICGALKDYYYRYESIELDCKVKNNGNVFLQDVDICVQDCKRVDLGISEEKDLKFDLDLDSYSGKKLFVKAENNNLSKVVYLDIDIYETPELEFDELTFPKEIGYLEDSELRFVANSNSFCKLMDLDIGLSKYVFENVKKKDIIMPFKGGDFIGNSIKVKCVDLNDKVYEVEKKFDIKMLNLPSWVKIKLFVLDLFY